MKNRLEQAESSLAWLRGWVKPEDIRDEFQELVKAVRPELQLDKHIKCEDLQKKEPEAPAALEKTSCLEMMSRYRQRTFLLPFALISYCFFAGHFSGMTTLTTFAVNIFATFGAPVDKYLATMILGIAQLAGTSLCVVLIHYTGKRPLVFISTFGSAIFFVCAGFYAHFFLGITKLDNGMHIKTHFDGVYTYSWVPMTLLISGAFLAYMGLRLVPWILIGEVYPPEIRGFASGVSGSVGYIFGFASNKTFFKLLQHFTLPGVYWFYGGVGFVSVLIFYFFLPETEGYTLHEVQEHFAGHRNLVKAGKRKSDKVEAKGVENPAMVDDQTSRL